MRDSVKTYALVDKDNIVMACVPIGDHVALDKLPQVEPFVRRSGANVVEVYTPVLIEAGVYAECGYVLGDAPRIDAPQRVMPVFAEGEIEEAAPIDPAAVPRFWSEAEIDARIALALKAR